MSDYAEIIEPVARLLLGEPNRALSSKAELRYGSRGSLSVDLKKGTWFDHETEVGGGTLDLITRETGLIETARSEWMHEHGFELDRRPKPNGSGHFKIVKTYDYVDVLGKLLFQVCRLDPKDFRQRKPDSNAREGWSWSVRGVPNVPYRLPELLEAIASGQTVFVVEGEKDVDNLWSIGIPATTNAGGAGKWRDELNDYFRDADVVVIEDFDPQKLHPKTKAPMFHDNGRPILPGQDHAQAVAEALSDVALHVRLLKLKRSWPAMPLKGDVSDWLAAPGHTRERLDALVAELPAWSPGQDDEATDFVDVINPFPINGETLPRRPWLIPGLLLRRQVTLIVAPPGSGKSLLTLQLAIVCASGIGEWAGWRPRGCYRTLVINVEEDETEMRRRLFGACRKMEIAQGLLTGILLAQAKATSSIVIAKADSRTKTVTATPMLERIIRTIEQHSIDLVIVDPFAETFAGDENSNSELKWAGVLWREVARRTNVAVLLVHHAKKYAQHMAGDMDAGRGGGALAGVARIVSTLFTMTEHEYETFHAIIKKQFEQAVDRTRFIRFDDAKANLSIVSPHARWFCKESIGIGNAGDGLPEDEVGVLMPWVPPDPFSNLDIKKANEILNEIIVGVRDDNGEPTKDPYCPTKKGGTKRWVGKLIQRELACSEQHAKTIIDKWLETGLLVEYQAPTSNSKGNNRECLKVDERKRPGTVTEESFL